MNKIIEPQQTNEKVTDRNNDN